MSRIVTCLDCPMYQTGGYCRHKKKDVGALTPACDHAKEMNKTFNPEEEEPMETKVNQPEPVVEAPEPQRTKVCPRCGKELPVEAFGKHSRTRDGLQPYCRQCRSQARQGKTSRPGTETKTSFIKAEKPADHVERVVVREVLTDKQMVDLLREHGWTVTCEKYEKVEL